MSAEIQIQETLETLLTLTREEFWFTEATDILLDNTERYMQLYKENGTIASLTHRIILNKEIAHPFCYELKECKNLWKEKEIQKTFAEALRQGDGLLVDGVHFLPDYTKNHDILDAVAHNIATSRSILFQVAMTSSMGLYNYPKIRKAIQDRKEDIIQQIKENWHHGSLVVSTPFLINDDDIQQAIMDSIPHISHAIRTEDRLVDAAVLVQQVEWIRNDPEIVKAIRDRLLDTKANFADVFMKEAAKVGIFYQHPELMDALNTRSTSTREYVLGL